MSQGPAWPLNSPNITSLLCLVQVYPSRPISQGCPKALLLAASYLQTTAPAVPWACGTVTSYVNLGLFQRAWLAIWASLITALITLSCTGQLHVYPSPLDREFPWGKGRILLFPLPQCLARKVDVGEKAPHLSVCCS